MGNYIFTSDGELYHYGVKGMKWGVRRFQKKDGTLTPAGKKRYESLSENERLTRAQDLGARALSTYEKLDEEYASKVMVAAQKGDQRKIDKLQNEFDERFKKEVYEPLVKSGYDYVYRGGGSEGLSLQFGKELSKVEYDQYGCERFIDDFMITSGDMKVYRSDDF